MEEVFAEAREAETAAEELLVNDDWRTSEVEPEIVEAHRNGTNGNGPVVDEGAANGHEADEAVGSVFSWAEFTVQEPVKRNGRRRHQPQPASATDPKGIVLVESVSFQPAVNVQSSMLAGAQHNLSRRSSVLRRVVMLEGDAQVSCDSC